MAGVTGTAVATLAPPTHQVHHRPFVNPISQQLSDQVTSNEVMISLYADEFGHKDGNRYIGKRCIAAPQPPGKAPLFLYICDL
jgi:hypothetical protein